MAGPSFEDRTDFDNADRGFVAKLEPGVIKAGDGRVVWDSDAYEYLNGESPDTMNPVCGDRHNFATIRRGMSGLGEMGQRIIGSSTNARPNTSPSTGSRGADGHDPHRVHHGRGAYGAVIAKRGRSSSSFATSPSAVMPTLSATLREAVFSGSNKQISRRRWSESNA